MRRVCLVLPAFNEEGNLTPLVSEVMAVAHVAALDLVIVAVDDGSVDGTAAELLRLRGQYPEVRIVTHEHNRGFAAALKDGVAAACREDVEALVFMDSDLSHSPKDLPRLVAALESGADVALGSRFVSGGGMAGVPWWRVLISRTGNLVGRTVLGLRPRDLTTGYRAFRREVLELLPLEEDSFAIQLEAVVKASAAGYRVVEVPIVLGTRKHGASHMNYSAKLFATYFRLLLKCRRWLSEGRAAASHAATRS